MSMSFALTLDEYNANYMLLFHPQVFMPYMMSDTMLTSHGLDMNVTTFVNDTVNKIINKLVSSDVELVFLHIPDDKTLDAMFDNMFKTCTYDTSNEDDAHDMHASVHIETNMYNMFYKRFCWKEDTIELVTREDQYNYFKLVVNENYECILRLQEILNEECTIRKYAHIVDTILNMHLTDKTLRNVKSALMNMAQLIDVINESLNIPLFEYRDARFEDKCAIVESPVTVTELIEKYQYYGNFNKYFRYKNHCRKIGRRKIRRMRIPFAKHESDRILALEFKHPEIKAFAIISEKTLCKFVNVTSKQELDNLIQIYKDNNMYENSIFEQYEHNKCLDSNYFYVGVECVKTKVGAKNLTKYGSDNAYTCVYQYTSWDKCEHEM